MIDFKLSNDGDLVLGQQQTDEDGYLLYYQDNENNEGEVLLTTDPELGTVPVRDLELAHDEDAELQLIKSRIQTDNPDWYNYPNIGANLSDLIGELNTPETAERGKNLILESLTRGQTFKSEDLTIEAIPVSGTNLLFDVRLKRHTRFVRYALIFDFEVGIVNEYQIKEDN